MMKIVIVMGSPRKGETEKIVRSFEEEVKTHGKFDFNYIYLKDMNLKECRGCMLCLEKGEELCPQKGDDRDFIIQQITEADGVIFASPVYSLQVTAQMKRFLDRLAFIFHRPQFFHKAFMALTTQGVYGDKGVIKYLNEVAEFWGFIVCQGLGVTTPPGPRLPEEENKIKDLTAKAANRFYNTITGNKSPEPSFKQLMIFRMVRTAHKCGITMERDIRYYKENGWFESEYYYQTKIGYLKRFIVFLAELRGKGSLEKVKEQRDKLISEINRMS